MATVWVALATETVMLLAAAGAAVKWVRRSATSTPDQVVEPVSPVTEQLA